MVNQEAYVFVWLIIALLSLCLEMINPGFFFFLSFTLGAISASLASWYNYSPSFQLLIALGTTSIALLLLTFCFTKKRALSQQNYKSNTDALIGQKGVVIKALTDQEVGQVKVQGEIWSAKSLHNNPMAVGQSIEVIATRGAYLIIKKI